MKMISVTIKDLKIFLKDRSAILMLFLMPFVFIVAISLISRNASSSNSTSEESKMALVIVNNDPQGISTDGLIRAIENAGSFEVHLQDQAATEDQLNQSTLRYALFIPVGFGADMADGKQVTLRLAVHPLANETDLMNVEMGLGRALQDFMMMDYLNQGLIQMGEMQAADPNAQNTFSNQRIQQQVALQKAQAQQRPLITVVETNPVSTTSQEATSFPEIGQVVVLGMAVLFVFLGAQNTAMSIYKEKKLGSFRRLMSAPINKAALLAGKLLPNFILSIVQIAVIFLTGGYLIRFLGLTPLNFTSSPLGLVIISLGTALCSTSLGILIASLARTESQVGGLSSVILFVAGILSGSFVPTFLFPESLKNIARFLPQFWANEAFLGLVFRGQTLADLWQNAVILLVFTLAFFGIGLWRFKFD
jgi:ABC-2 type transport system permease protein